MSAWPSAVNMRCTWKPGASRRSRYDESRPATGLAPAAARMARRGTAHHAAGIGDRRARQHRHQFLYRSPATRHGDACRGVSGRGHAYLITRSEEHTSELQSRENLVCRLLLEKKNDNE